MEIFDRLKAMLIKVCLTTDFVDVQEFQQAIAQTNAPVTVTKSENQRFICMALKRSLKMIH